MTFMTDRFGRALQLMTVALILVLLVLELAPRGSEWVESRRIDQFAQLLLRVEDERDGLREEVARLREEQATIITGQQRVEALERELERARIAAGFIALRGPGLEVVVADGKPADNVDPNRLLVHDEDVLRIVNELAAAGAEAMAINGQRVVGTTEIRCAGPVISINNTRTAPPVSIVAIGDPQTLEAALRMRGGIIDRLALWGVEVEVRTASDVEVPAFSGAIMFRHAIPVGKGS